MIAENWLQLIPDNECDNIKRHFAKATQSYDQAARLQKLTAAQLLNQNLPYIQGQVLDLGCGTGLNTVKLLAANPKGQLIAYDLSHQMVMKTKQRLDSVVGGQHVVCMQGDANHLPFTAQLFDLVYSNLMLQWLDDLVPALTQIKQSLKSDGQLIFTTLLHGTLIEYQQAWAAVDSDNHINQFLTLDQLIHALEQAGLAFDIKIETVRLDYPQVTDLARELKQLGANYVKARRHQGLTGRGKWQAVANGYEAWRQDNGLLPATYQVAYVRAKNSES